MRANVSASSNQHGGTTVGLSNSDYKVVRCYIRFSTLPDGDCLLLYGAKPTPSRNVGIAFHQSDSKIYPAFDDGNATFTLGSTGASVTTGQWYRIDLKIFTQSTTFTIDAQVDGIALTQLAVSGQTAGQIANVEIGVFGAGVGAVTCDVFYDDLIVSQTDTDYPIGAGYVNHFVPTSDGTHNVAGAADFRRTLTTTDILNTTTDAYQLVDDVPLESGASVDWINMVAPPNATDYVECVFGPAPGISTPTAGPRAVEVIAGIHQAGTGAGNMEIRMNDNGTTDAMYSATGVAGVTSVAYKRKHYATNIANGGPWTATSGAGNFNNLRVRFGSPAAVDANPDQYFDCIMVEAEFAEATVAINESNYDPVWRGVASGIGRGMH